MSQALFKVNTIAAEILAELYVLFEHQPNDLSDHITALFPKNANIFNIPEEENEDILRLIKETIDIFTSKTEWKDYHNDFTGLYAHLLNPSVILAKRMARLT